MGEPVLVPLTAALVVVAVTAVLGGGRHPWWEDAMVYLAVAMVTWIAARELSYRARLRREDATDPQVRDDAREE
jgi:hypothetical protein